MRNSSDSAKLVVMGISFDTMGHAVAETNLKIFLPQAYDHVEYRSKLFSEVKTEMGVLAKLILLISYPLFTSFKYDIFINRLRSEIAYSLVIFIFFLRLNKTGIDVFHFRTQSICFFVQFLFKKYKSVITIDMTARQLINLRPHNALFYLPITWFEKMVFSKAFTTVTYSDCAGSSVIKDYKVDSTKVKTIYPPVKDSFYSIRRKEDVKMNILFVGNDFIRKGGDVLTEVVSTYFRETAELHIVSNDPSINSLHDGVYLHKNIQANSPELLELYSRADIFVLPTREEAYGIVFGEAMAAGLPCIGSDTMAIPELITNEIDGFCIPIGNKEALREKISFFIKNPDRRKEMAVRAKMKAEDRFRLKKHLKLYYEVFKR